MPEDAAFSELLKRHRHAAGYSQETLAERAGISSGAVAALEQGVRRAPYRDTVNALTGALGLSDVVRREFERAAAVARRRHRQSESGLPASLTSFVERGEVSELQALLSERRLLTVTGSGGVGKTRIAVEVARRAEEHYDGTGFVDLLPLRDGTMVAPHIAAGLNVPTEGEDGLTGVVRHFQGRHALLVLDNCEHVIAEAASAIDTLLRRCHSLTILATSREPLALSGELAFRLPSMDAAAAAELFVTRARSVDPALIIDTQRRAIVLEICRELDGIPLAIELAASHLPTLGFAELLKRLRSDIPLVGSRDLPTRHQTMTATIAWSYDLLDSADRLLFRRSSVFLGGFTLASAEEVCADEALPTDSVADGVSRLVQKSLLSLEREGTSARYRFLDSIRSYAWQQLSKSGQARETILRFMKWLERQAATLDSSPSRELMVEERAELDNVAAAVMFGELAPDDETGRLAARILFGFRRVWQGTNREPELRKLAFGLLDRLRAPDNAEIAGLLLFALAPHLTHLELRELAPRAIQLLTSAGYISRAANVHARLAQIEGPGNAAGARHHLGKVAELLSTPELRRTREGIVAIIESAYVHRLLGDFSAARAALAQLEIPPGESYEVEACIVLADIEFGEGHVERAIEILEEIEPQLERYHNANVLGVMVSGNLALFRLSLDDVPAASAHLSVALRQVVDARDLGFLSVTTEYARYAAALAALSGRLALAVRLLRACETVRERTGSRMVEDFPLDLAMREIDAKLPRAEVEALRARATSEDIYELLEEFLGT